MMLHYQRLLCVALLQVCSLLLTVFGLDDGLARTPPMGWMTWQRYRCTVDCKRFPDDCISEPLIKRSAYKMAKDGWLDAGYKYVIIDDCWFAKERSSKGQLQPDAERFPSGMKALGDYVHTLGLKYGIYLDFGTKTCAGYPGSQNYIDEDTALLAEWGADYVKLDGCFSDPVIQPDGYERFGRALNKTGRPMVFSCSYPAYVAWQRNETLIDWKRLQTNCHLWRMLDDIEDAWWSVKKIIKSYADHNQLLQPLAGPGHWNDPDMLILGNFGLSDDQQRVQMGMWCMFAAPLLLSTDLHNVSPYTTALLQNKQLISINQDKGGQQAKLLTTKNSIQMWYRQLFNDPPGWAIAFYNEAEGGPPTLVQFRLRDFGIHQADPHGTFQLIDVFTGKIKSGVDDDTIVQTRVNPSGIQMTRVIPSSKLATHSELFF